MGRRALRVISVLIITMLFFFNPVKAQNLDETLSNLGTKVAESYVQPITSAFGSDLNSGWFNKVPDAKFLGLDFELKVVVSGSFLQSSNKTFNVSGTFRFTPEQINQILVNSSVDPNSVIGQGIKNEMLSKDFDVNISGPTIIGSDKDHLIVQFPGAVINGQTLAAQSIEVAAVKGYLNNLSALPMGAVQLSVGTVYGTSASFRWLPSVDIQNMGKSKLFGFGIMHNPGIWLPNPLPINIAVGFFTEKLTVGDIFKSVATQYGIFASKTFGMGITFTPYVGLTKETSTTTIRYNYIISTPNGTSTSNISFDLSGKNDIGVTLGAALKLFALNISADYKLANTRTASVAISFVF